MLVVPRRGSVHSLHLDWETRSVADLREVGLRNYATHATTDIWCAAYSFDESEPLIWLPGEPCPAAITRHVAAGGVVRAWNAPFEMAIWRKIAAPRYGWPSFRVEQFECSMAAAYAMGLPGALEDAALALGLSVLKDSEGRGLMLRMARPRRAEACPNCVNGVAPKGGNAGRTRWTCETCHGTGTLAVWWDDADKIARLHEYCRQDVRVERELHKRLVPLSEKERRVWLMDYEINERGVRVDVETAKAAVAMTATVKEKCNDALGRLTGGAVQSANAVAALKEWLAGQGCPVESLAKQDVSDLLADEAIAPAVRKALLLRQEASKASTAKLGALVSKAGADGRLRGTVQYHGAATGRWAGRGVQVHNLPREVPKNETVEKILALVRQGQVDAIDLIYGPPMTMVSKCIRGFFVAGEGSVLVAGDFANVEGRGVAWFAGEEWKLRAFREADAGTGPGIYELAYAKAFHVPVESVLNPSFERQVGKTMELAFGYGGGVGAFKTMGKNMGVNVPDAKADEFKVAWRAAHPRVKNTWYALERAAIAAVQNPGSIYSAGHPGREVRYKTAGSFLWCMLPSGRVLCYPYPKVLEGDFGPQLTYMKVPSPDAADKGKIIHDPKNSSNWARVKTYGGSLMENVIQAICRDLLVEVLLRVKGFAVLHVHDEIVIEVPEAKADEAKRAMEGFMRETPAWAAGFPLFAECKTMRRYGKG